MCQEERLGKLVIYSKKIYVPRVGRVRTLQEYTGDAMKKHLVDQEADNQRSQLNSNDIKIGIECGTHRGWIQKENVGPVVGSSRSIFAALFLQEEHLKRQEFPSISTQHRFEILSSHDSS